MGTDLHRRHRGCRRLSTRLQHEWDQLCRRPAVLAAVRSWDVTEHRFDTLDELLELCGHCRGGDLRADDGDAVLHRLCVRATADPLAARIVLQRLLPGLLSIVAAEQRRDPAVDAFDLLVGEAWVAIRSYRPEPRRPHVASRLLNAARHRAFTAPRRRAERHRQLATITPRPHPEEGRSSFEELVSVLTEARARGLSDDDLAVVHHLLGPDTVAELAAAQDVTPRTVRNHRARAIRRLRRLAAAS